MNNPKLITAPDERVRCCIFDDDGNRCPNETAFWVGTNGIDDYTHVCADHLDSVKRDGDAVHEIHNGVVSYTPFQVQLHPDYKSGFIVGKSGDE